MIKHQGSRSDDRTIVTKYSVLDELNGILPFDSDGLASSGVIKSGVNDTGSGGA